MNSLSKVSQRVGFVGAGNMAGALMRGLCAAGLKPERVAASDLDRKKLDALAAELGVQPKLSAQALVEDSDVVVLAVKPKDILGVAESLGSVRPNRLWISVAAGVSCTALDEALGTDQRLVRAMPNTPALVGAGATGLCGGARATEQDLELAEQLLGAVGITERIDESLMDALTGLSGGGPAYLMLVIEAMADGAVRAGLPRATALRLAAQTVEGAGKLARESGQHPAQLKDAVTSPNGTTICGVEALERAGIRAAFMNAVAASAARSKELSRGE